MHVHAEPQPDASRWLWLVKWLLLIPHAIVLVCLWVAFVVMSIVAFVAILVTGRYPRSVFDFNVGVLRWSWRVSFYGYSALATDRYPPFTLADDPDYPAHLEVDYPAHLSRGLVLVKWWLLALPHYLVVGILVGGGTWWVADDPPARFAWGGGLVGLLVLVSAIVLAATGSYPRPLYDLVLGLNRWVLRVWAYAGLMTDVYPPFRLDQGPDEVGPDPAPTDVGGPPVTGSGATAPVAPSGAYVVPAAGNAVSNAVGQVPNAANAVPSGGTVSWTAGPRPTPQPGWTAGRVVALVVGSIIGVAGLGVLTGGFAMEVVDHTARDSAGYITVAETHVDTPGYAVVAPPVRIESASAALPRRVVGDLRIRVVSDASAPVFVGVAPSFAVDRYLTGVARTTPGVGRNDDRDFSGSAPASPPGDVAIWDASKVGSGPLELVWSPRPGDWDLVLMNADGSATVGADVAVGAQLSWLGGLGAAALLGGLVLTAGGVTLVASATRRASFSRPAAPVAGADR
ncbi:hypothetical protein GCM10009845_11960 [Pedococcus bigeumensis]